MATERKPGFQRPPDCVQCCTCGEWYDAENQWHTCDPMPFLSPRFSYYRARLPADFWKGRAARRRARVKPLVRCEDQRPPFAAGGYYDEQDLEPCQHESAGRVLVPGCGARLWTEKRGPLDGDRIDGLPLVRLHLCKRCGVIYGETG